MEQWFSYVDSFTGKEVATVTGRIKKPLRKKLNPLWWFMNEDEPNPPDWHMPGRPTLIRLITWYFRNPLHNMGKYVIGVHDRNYTVVGMPPVRETHVEGWKYSVICIGILRLPYVSYLGKHWTFYAGWQWWGFFGIKLHPNGNKLQLW